MTKPTTFKKIESMPYGTPEQMRSADIWYSRFVKFAETHPLLAEAVWKRIHLTDIGYQARGRWMYRD